VSGEDNKVNGTAVYQFRFVKRDLKNWLRERNATAVLALRRLVQSFAGKDREARLQAISDVLRHFAESPGGHRIARQGLRLAANPDLDIARPDTAALIHSLILKPYVSPQEKGFLLVSFEKELAKLVSAETLRRIEKRFYIIFLPSWTGLFSPPLFALAARSSQKFFVMPVHKRERAASRLLGPDCIPLPFNAASWVKAEFFQDRDLERDIDCLMVANFAEFKRHWILFKALQGLPASVRAVCVGVPMGKRTSQTIRQETEDYGVADRVDIIEDPSQKDLRLYFQRARVFCALSYREGSFISVAEALMSGTPVVMFRNAFIGTKELINSRNGALVDSVAGLRESILHLISNADHSAIQAESEGVISASANCHKLNAMLKDITARDGAGWTRDIFHVFNIRLEFYYEDNSARQQIEEDIEYLTKAGIKLKLAQP
jgi:glycosyltransferase involved in cell wall biosynthesis